MQKLLLDHIATPLLTALGTMSIVVGALFGGATASLAADSSADKLIIANQECNATGQVKVTYSWTSAAQGNQWLDLSRVPDNFVSPALMSVGPIASAQNTAVTDGLSVKTPYYVRVNTQSGSGWSASSTLSFTTRTCDGAPSVAAGGGTGGYGAGANMSAGGDGGSYGGDGGGYGGGGGGY